MSALHITTTEEDAGKRLDVFLTERHHGVSRSRIQKLIKTGEITVNDTKVTPHFALSEGDVVGGPSLAPTPERTSLDPRDDIPLTIVHEDDAVIVVDKPSGLIVHPSMPDESDTLANALVARYPEIADVGESWERPGIVHRLDKEASGLMVVARTAEAYASLKAQFQAHTILKEYAVLVHDGPVEGEGTINFPISRLKGSGRMAARPEDHPDARPAVTHFTVDERFTHAALLTVRTETGRTHQIRVHMKAMDMPVAGDTLYRKKKQKPLPTERLFLHAKTLEFDHPTSDERMRFESPLPEALERTLTTLRKS